MLWNAILLAVRELRRNVLRSFLTVLGIVIGVAAVIVMVTIGGGATAQVTAQIASLGSNVLMVTPGQRMGMGQRSSAQAFDLEDAEAIEREVNSLAAVAPLSSEAVTAVYGNENWSTSVRGVTNSYFQAANWSLETGREFTDTELRAGQAVCILGATVRKELFGTQNPLGSKIRFKKVSCQVIGLLASKGQSTMGTDQDDLILTPLRTFQRRVSGTQDVGMIQVSVKDGASTEKAASEISELMRKRRHIGPAEDDNFAVMDLKEVSNMLSSTTRALTGLLGAVAAVSLLVGGIGIMNIMLVSVTERTREIGIRMAIGARGSDIRTQFLMEALLLSVAGGIIGIVLGTSASKIITGFLGWATVVSTGSIVLAFGFSVFVGIFFGFYPAWKASLLNPIEALRYE